MSKQSKHLRNIRSNISDQMLFFLFCFPHWKIIVRYGWRNNTLVLKILNLKCDGERWIQNLQEKRIRTSAGVDRTPGPALQTICHEMPTNSDEATLVKPLRNHHDLLSYIIWGLWDEAIPASGNFLKCLQPILHHMWCDIIMTCCSVAVQDYDLYFRAEQLIHLYKEHNGNRKDQTKKKTKEIQLRKMKKSQIIRMVCNCWRYNGRFWQ